MPRALDYFREQPDPDAMNFPSVAMEFKKRHKMGGLRKTTETLKSCMEYPSPKLALVHNDRL